MWRWCCSKRSGVAVEGEADACRGTQPFACMHLLQTTTAAPRPRCALALPRCGAAWRRQTSRISRSMARAVRRFLVCSCCVGSQLAWLWPAESMLFLPHGGDPHRRSCARLAARPPARPCADFAPSTAAGQLGHASADVLLGCLEVAMEDYLEELTAEEAGGDGRCCAALRCAAPCPPTHGGAERPLLQHAVPGTAS